MAANSGHSVPITAPSGPDHADRTPTYDRDTPCPALHGQKRTGAMGCLLSVPMERPSLANRWWFGASLLFIGLIALVLRLSGTGDRTLFWDEAYHVRLILAPSVGEMLGAVLANPPSDPLFALLLRAWSMVAGTTDMALRLPSALFGALTTTAAAWLAIELVRDRRVAILAAAVFAVAPYAIEYGQEASLYSFAALATTLALAACWRWRRSAATPDAVVAIGLSIVGVYSHYAVAPILLVVALLSVSRLGGARAVSGRQVAVAAAIVLFAWVPWLVPMLGAWAGAGQTRTDLLSYASPSELLGALSQYSSGTGALLLGIRPLQALGLVAAAFLLGRGWLVGRAADRRGVQVVLIAAAVTFLVPWAVSAVTGMWLFVAHMMLFLLPALAVAASAGAIVREAPLRAGAPAAAGVVAAVVLISAQVWGVAVNHFAPPHGDDGSRDLAVALASRAQPEEPVLIAPHEQQIIFERYWHGRLAGLPADFDLHGLYRARNEDADLESSIERFDALAGAGSRAWLVYTPARGSDAEFVEWLGRDWEVTLVEERPFGRLLEITRR